MKAPTDGRRFYWQPTIYNRLVLMENLGGRYYPTTTTAPANAGWLQLTLLVWLH